MKSINPIIQPPSQPLIALLFNLRVRYHKGETHSDIRNACKKDSYICTLNNFEFLTMTVFHLYKSHFPAHLSISHVGDKLGIVFSFITYILVEKVILGMALKYGLHTVTDATEDGTTTEE
jgi:hypothetical protein